MMSYQLKGNRVLFLHAQYIEGFAHAFCNKFKLNKMTDFEAFFELFSKFGITIHLKSNKEWEKHTLGLTDGHCDPSTLTITIPETTYKKACKGHFPSLSIMFHEFGHLLLGHKALLHHSDKEPTENEDAEWQADMFAEFVLKFIGYIGGEQMSLKLD